MARKVVRIHEVADMIGVPLPTLRWWRHRGEGPPMFLIGRRVVAYQDEVEAWLDAQRAKGA
ncbi:MULTISPECIES: helix-turn-helix transcriptional regulator [Pseudonocardia]|uniref:Helix-turn-helix domain protein n=2 Tax=Pseudonocardia TaxID=1847 RepID=A0A1Y2MLF6_PSEAH|nr:MULTISPECIES: helix-turn-helix domain-containing protein [Pseudonocardia]OSY36113.1 Helix-turn-helix domain protein [Pseudonocardia autotrophica]TDN77595.1 helix-turn-helix protein [Pseudonocardia autotrophica]BBG01625.1 hypothetical protein Pdca_28340 [Pseudonocardia autotrophica]GEC25370.1 hypothetical protein PSA01_23990 [Pseudonocardia saturnea]